MTFINCIFQFHPKSKMKENQARPVQFFLFPKYYGISITFEAFFLVRFISKMNNDCSKGKMSII